MLVFDAWDGQGLEGGPGGSSAFGEPGWEVRGESGRGGGEGGGSCEGVGHGEIWLDWLE